MNDYKLFNFQEFTHINCMTDTLISNTLEDIDLIIGNFKYWLKKNGGKKYKKPPKKRPKSCDFFLLPLSRG